MPKKILILVTQLEAGGAQMASIKLRDGLIQKGYSSELFFLYKKSDFEDLASNCLLDYKPNNLYDYLKIVSKLFLLVRRKKPDTLISFTYFSNILVQLVGLFNFVPRRIASQRNPYSAIPNYIKKIDLLFGHWNVYTKIVMVSKSVKDSFDKASLKYQRKSVVIPNGVVPFDHKVFRSDYQFTDTDFIIIHVGRFSPEKNHKLLFKSLPLEKDVHLILVGDGPLRQEYEMDFAKNKNIHFIGQVSQEQVQRYMSIADLFVLPSVYEGMSNALIEALVMQLPVLVSDIPPNREVLMGSVSNAILPIEDLRKWKDVLYQLTKKEEDYFALKEQCSKVSMNYGVDKMLNRFLEIV